MCNITLGRKQSKSWFYRATKTICLHNSWLVEMLYKQWKQAAGRFLKDCWMWSSTYSILYQAVFPEVQFWNYSGQFITFPNDPVTWWVHLHGTYSNIPSPRSSNIQCLFFLFFHKSTCQIQFFLLWCPEKQNNIHSQVPHMFSRH